jgi:hypothetical protein
VAGGRRALVVATYDYADGGLSRLEAPAHDAESFASVLADRAIAGFDVTMLVDKPHHVVGEAIADFYGSARRDDLTLLYFTGHGVKDDEGRLYLAMNNTRREALMFTAISAAQLNDAMDASASRRKVLVLDCCYSGAFPAGRTAKSDEGVQTLERFQGKGRAVLTASDATQYAFEGNDLRGSATSSVFTRHLVEAISSGAADLDEDGDIALDELYSYVYDRVVAEVPQQRPKKQEDVDGRIVIARNVHWQLPAFLRHAIESPIAAQRLSALPELEHLHRAGNAVVRAAVEAQLEGLASDDSRSVSAAASGLLDRLRPGKARPEGTRAPAAPERPTRVLVGPPPTARRVASPDAPVQPEAPAPSRPGPPADVGSPAAGVAAGPVGRFVPGVLPTLLVVAGIVLGASRFLVFEASNGYHAVDIGWSTATWVVQVLLPLALAAGVALARPGSPPVTALAGGLAAGVALSVACQLLTSVPVLTAADVGYTIGPAFWLILGGGLLLGTGAVLVAATSLGARTHLRRDRQSAVAAVLVVLCAVAWVVSGDVSTDFGWWLYIQIAELMFGVACLWVAVFDRNEGRRVFGLAAVTATGAWLAATGLEVLVARPSGYQPGALATDLIATLVALGAAWYGQRRRPATGPVAG